MYILGLQKTSLLDYPEHVASIVFTGGCNFRCPYCHNRDLVCSAQSMDEYSIKDILTHLKKRSAIYDGIVITGEEPTLQPDLLEFLQLIRNHTSLDIKLDTNGTHPAMIQKAVESSLVDYIAMDIKQSQDKYHQIASMPVLDIQAIEASVDYLLEDHIPYEFRTTICDELFEKEDILAIGQWIAGARAYFLQPYKETEQVISPIYHAPSIQTLKEYLQILQPYVPHAALRGIDE